LHFSPRKFDLSLSAFRLGATRCARNDRGILTFS
jgi:hypothetical protein